MRRLLPITLIAALACSQRPAQIRMAEPERFDRPDEAAGFYAAKRGITPGTHVEERYAAARAQMETMPHYSTAADAVIPRGGRDRATANAAATTLPGWTYLGPGNVGGRTRVLVFDPRDSNVMYAGAVSGGVWKTTDRGVTWTGVGDSLTNLTVNSLAIDPRNGDVIYAGTGEGYFREDVRGTALPLRGDGIFVTHDAGASWQHLTATASNADFQWVNDLAISSHDSRRIYAATRTGVWRSGDAGNTWSNVLPTSVKGGCLQLAMRSGADGDYLFASCGIFEQATVYRSEQAENDAPWTPVLSAPGMSRTSLAIAPSDPSVVYALAASNDPGPDGSTQNLLGVFRSDSSGDPNSWTKMVGIDSPDPLNRTLLSNAINALNPQCDGGSATWVPMGWHCNVIRVDPTDPNRVWAAGVDLFRSDDGGQSWAEASYWFIDHADPAYVHADQHAIVFDPHYDGNMNRTLFVTNDGGVFRTDNATAALVGGTQGACNKVNVLNWVSLDHGFGATQFYQGSVSPDGQRFIGGAQDNGTALGDVASGPDRWSEIWGGDGGFTAIDPVTPNVMYVESQNAAIMRSTNGGKSFSAVRLPGARPDSFLFIAPFTLDPSQHTRLWIGGDRIWRSDDSGSTVAPASASLDGHASAIAVAPARSQRVLAGTEKGAILRSDAATSANTTTTWAGVTPRSGFVSSLTFDPANADIAYATYAGFGGGAHVWRSIDGGVTWSALDGTGDGQLPDIPAHSLAIDPSSSGRMYLGTDLGVFVSIDGGGHWMVEESGFPQVITESVTIATGSNGPAVYAFTHGRGVWRASLLVGHSKRRAVR